MTSYAASTQLGTEGHGLASYAASYAASTRFKLGRRRGTRERPGHRRVRCCAPSHRRAHPELTARSCGGDSGKYTGKYSGEYTRDPRSCLGKSDSARLRVQAAALSGDSDHRRPAASPPGGTRTGEPLPARAFTVGTPLAPQDRPAGRLRWQAGTVSGGRLGRASQKHRRVRTTRNVACDECEDGPG